MTRAHLWIFCALLLLNACGRSPANIEWQAPAMGTMYTIKTVGVPRGVARDALKAEVESILAQVDRVFSTYRTDSEISRFNRADSTDWQSVSDELVALVEIAQSLSRRTEGAFDITLGLLASLWGFGPELREIPRVPNKAEIATTRRHVGFQKLQYRLQPSALRKLSGGLQIDLNALVAGHAADRVAARFEQLGIRNYLVDMGGEFRVRGHNAGGKDWSIAIERPLPGKSAVKRVLKLTDCAISTSGNYRNYFEVEGQRYAHVLDGRSGQPIRHGLASVTVLAPTATQADALATALLILGEQQGHALAEQDQIAALFISRQGSGFVESESPAFAAYSSR